MREAMLRSAVALVAALAMPAMPGPAAAEALGGACVQQASEQLVCGTGPAALRIIEGTTSPSGKLAIGWRAPGVEPGDAPDPEGVEHHLVRLSDGKPLALTVGRYWAGEEGRATRVTVHAAWSRDSRWLVLGDSGRWAVEALAVYSIGADDSSVRSAGLFKLLTGAGGRALVRVVGPARATEFAMDIDSRRKIEVGTTGMLSIPVDFYIPKQESEFSFVAQFRTGEAGGRLIARLASFVRVKVPPAN